MVGNEVGLRCDIAPEVMTGLTEVGEYYMWGR